MKVPSLIALAKTSVAISVWTNLEHLYYGGEKWSELVIQANEDVRLLIVSNVILNKIDMADTLDRVGYQLKLFHDRMQVLTRVYRIENSKQWDLIWSCFGYIVGVREPVIPKFLVVTPKKSATYLQKLWKRIRGTKAKSEPQEDKTSLLYFYILCNFCDEKKIEETWNRMSQVEKSNVQVLDFLVGFWVARLRGFCLRTLLNSRRSQLQEWEGAWDENRNPNVFLWRLSALNNNRLAADYFFKQMTYEEKSLSVYIAPEYLDDIVLYALENLRNMYSVGIIPFVCNHLESPFPGENAVAVFIPGINKMLFPAFLYHLLEKSDGFEQLHRRIMKECLEHATVEQKLVLLDRPSAVVAVFTALRDSPIKTELFLVDERVRKKFVFISKTSNLMDRLAQNIGSYEAVDIYITILKLIKKG